MAEHSELLEHAAGAALSPERPAVGRAAPEGGRAPTQVHRQKNHALKNTERFEEEKTESNV